MRPLTEIEKDAVKLTKLIEKYKDQPGKFISVIGKQTLGNIECLKNMIENAEKSYMGGV